MQYIDELRDNAGTHFREWLRALAAGESSARAAVWGLGLDLGGLSPEDAFVRVAEAVDRHASRHRVLYAAATCGGPYDDGDAIESALAIMAVVAERGMSEAEREVRRRDRIVARVREGSYDEGDIEWLEIKAAGMTDAQVLAMQPFGEERVMERLAASLPRRRPRSTSGRGGPSSRTSGTSFYARAWAVGSGRAGTRCSRRISTSSPGTAGRPSSSPSTTSTWPWLVNYSLTKPSGKLTHDLRSVCQFSKMRQFCLPRSPHCGRIVGIVASKDSTQLRRDGFLACMAAMAMHGDNP